MKILHVAFALLLGGLALTAHAASNTVTDPDKPRQLPESGPVAVSWSDPAQFSELRYSNNRWEAERGDWVRQLAEHLRKSAASQLQPGERLEVTITDIRRAGNYEPWRGMRYDSVRIVRDLYPPQVDLDYTLYAANGEVLAQGESKLRNIGFLFGASPINQNDNLRHEKRLIDDWARRQLRPRAAQDGP